MTPGVVEAIRQFNVYVGGTLFLILLFNTIVKRYRLRDRFSPGQFGVRLYLLALVAYGSLASFSTLAGIPVEVRVAGLACLYGAGVGVSVMEGFYLLERVKKRHSERKHGPQ